MRISGSPQMRQSAGNSVAKRLSAIPPAQAAIEDPLPAECAWVARVRSPVLLKTTSRRPEGTFWAPTRRCHFSIAARYGLTQCADDLVAAPAFPFGFPCDRPPWPLPRSFPHQTALDPFAAALAHSTAATTGNNNLRNARASGTRAGEGIVPRNSAGAKHTLRDLRNDGSEIL
jgi:hypothetical protein